MKRASFPRPWRLRFASSTGAACTSADYFFLAAFLTAFFAAFLVAFFIEVILLIEIGD
jgi:hypothetical protein